ADRRALQHLIERTDDVDILVANAALPASGRIAALTGDEIDAALDVNLRAPILLARSLAMRMAARGSGHLVFINSLSGKVAAPGSSLYNATKFGLRGFAQSLRQELHGTGVGVSTIFPGFIREAGMFARSGATLPKGIGTRSPEEVASPVVRAIAHDLGAIDAAPPGRRGGGVGAGVAPRVSATLQRWLGASRIADDIARGQRGWR